MQNDGPGTLCGIGIFKNASHPHEEGKNVQISWNIGADGGSGTYLLVGNVLRAYITNNFDGTAMTVELTVEKNDGQLLLVTLYVDVQAIGPEGSSVGFATVNGAFHALTRLHMTLYVITDWLGLVPVFTALGFAVLGVVQLIKRKSLLKVDRDILVLGGFYLLVMAAYLLFEEVIINYRPVLIDGVLEAAYPSSTTILVLCVMPTAMMQFHKRVKNRKRERSSRLLHLPPLRLWCWEGWCQGYIGSRILSAAFCSARAWY